MPKTFKINSSGSGKILLEGSITLKNISKAKDALEKALRTSGNNVELDLSKLEHIDSSAILLFEDAKEKKEIKFTGISEDHKALFALIDENHIELVKEKPEGSLFYSTAVQIGKVTEKVKQDTVDIIAFLGRFCVEFVQIVLKPHEIRFGSIIHHIRQIGINAIPIVSLIAFLISIVLAYQGVAQLRNLGAERFTVDLVAISVLREMGVMLTAIMVAGRSGSAFTAEIGVMKLREEVDALSAVGLDPFKILVMPRMIALIICMPLLTFIANIMGMAGGALLCQSLIGISFAEYIARIQNVITLKTYVVGMIKAPVFALAIGVVACMHGMKVSGSSESVGKETTSSVVEAIFMVLLLDAAFSILFQKLGI